MIEYLAHIDWLMVGYLVFWSAVLAVVTEFLEFVFGGKND